MIRACLACAAVIMAAVLWGDAVRGAGSTAAFHLLLAVATGFACGILFALEFMQYGRGD